MEVGAFQSTVVQACHTSNQETEAGEPQIQGKPELLADTQETKLPF